MRFEEICIDDEKFVRDFVCFFEILKNDDVISLSWQRFKVGSLQFSGFGQVGTHHERNSQKKVLRAVQEARQKEIKQCIK